MNFICVLSVNGTLASYSITKENEQAYTAVLRSNNLRQEVLPTEIILTKTDGTWVGTPHHPLIVPSIVHAIEEGQ